VEISEEVGARIAVTERAKEYLLDMKLSANMNQPDVGLGLQAVSTGEWQLFPDKAAEGDQVVEHGGTKVLLIGADASDTLGDGHLDCQETAPGQVQFVLTRGDESGTDPRGKPS
jgi:hypothetical protein